MSGFVHKVSSFFVSTEKVLLEGNVLPSEKKRDEQKNVWVLCGKSGDVLSAYCTCTAGYSEFCNHVIVLLYKVEYAKSKSLVDPSCTEIACSWNKCTEIDIECTKIRVVQIRKHEVTNQTKKAPLNKNLTLVMSEYRAREYRQKEEKNC